MWMVMEIVIYPDGRVHFPSLPFPLPPGDNLKTTPNSVEIPLSLFDGYRREGFPMRVGVRILEAGKTVAAWNTNAQDWPSRLLQNSWTPTRAGVLPLD